MLEASANPKMVIRRAAWVMLTIDEHGGLTVDLHRVDYDIASMADAIRATPGLPNEFALNLETG